AKRLQALGLVSGQGSKEHGVSGGLYTPLIGTPTPNVSLNPNKTHAIGDACGKQHNAPDGNTPCEGTPWHANPKHKR
ncbi:MAG: hypothetical protein K0M73_14570, partial [Hydrogenophaga sp.]|nr:hypothetical protein [Hydrogenophaga sp.]